VPESAGLEAAEAFGFLGHHVDPVDARASWPFAAELDQPLDGIALTFENSLDRSVRPVCHPAGNGRRLRPPPQRLAEEDSLHVTLHDDAAALHGP
jgi:hypothetical protein